MQVNKTIYKKDTKGKIRFLTVTTQGRTVEQKSGIVGTANPVINISNCIGKNLGKSNETLPEEQAVLEANSTIKDKMTKGYFETIEEAENEVVILPMLANKYKDQKKKVKWGVEEWIAQPKLDGMRCLTKISAAGISMTSRDGKEITTMKHIEESLGLILDSGMEVVLDGELYVHGENFQTNMKAVKSYKKGLTERIGYHVYDAIHFTDPTFSERHKTLSKILAGLSSVHVVPNYAVSNEEEALRLHDALLEDGYEGLILRKADSKYKINGRSSDLLKYTIREDIAIKVIDVIPSEKRPEHGIPVFSWPGAKDDILKAGTKLSHEERVDLLVNKHNYIGKTAEVRFFGYSETGVPRQPVYHGLRLDK